MYNFILMGFLNLFHERNLLSHIEYYVMCFFLVVAITTTQENERGYGAVLHFQEYLRVHLSCDLNKTPA